MDQRKSGLFSRFSIYRKCAFVIGIYVFLSFAAVVMVVFRAVYTQRIAYVFLIWNLFLTWIPLCLALVLTHVYDSYAKSTGRSLFLFAVGAIWALFYPNAPYIITDFIHLSNYKYYYSSMGYNMNFIVWYDFVMFSLFILTGFLLGFVSLYLIQRLIKDRFNKWFGWLFVGCVLFLSSFGIYLGRFIRWNSWDIIANPAGLAKSILESFHRHAFAFTITFGLFLILIYIALYSLTRLNLQKRAIERRRS